MDEPHAPSEEQEKGVRGKLQAPSDATCSGGSGEWYAGRRVMARRRAKGRRTHHVCMQREREAAVRAAQAILRGRVARVLWESRGGELLQIGDGAAGAVTRGEDA
jgi:hypothetical protein